jgi:aminopeptidase
MEGATKMLSDRQIDNYCDVLLWALRTARKKRYCKGDVILVRCDLGAVKMAEILHAKLLDRGVNPVLRLGMTPKMEKDFFSKANKRQLIFQPPGEKELYDHLNGTIYLNAPDALTHLADVDSRRIGKVAIARKPLRDILDRREEKGEFGWTLCMFPTRELAKQAGLSMKQYETQVIRACYLDEDEPVRRWGDIFRDAMAIKKWLSRMSVQALHIESDRMDLFIKPGERRRWVGMTGHNIPSFEIFLSPDWRSTEGVFYANQASYRNGNYVEGVRLVFKKGSVIKAEAAKGEGFVHKYIGSDKGSGRVGEFSLTDKRFSRISRFMANTLYDENYGGLYGNCHLALGSSYSDSYSGDPSKLTKAIKNKLGFNDSAIHWDLVNTENKRVTAHLYGGEKRVVYEDGMFTY